jgi:putative transcription factor
MINERKSVIEQLENGRIRPDDKLVTKIERALNIRLKEKVSEEPVTLKKGGFTLTLGDLIKNGKK